MYTKIDEDTLEEETTVTKTHHKYQLLQQEADLERELVEVREKLDALK